MTGEQKRLARRWERTNKAPPWRLTNFSGTTTGTGSNRPRFSRGVTLENIPTSHESAGLMCSWKEAQTCIARWESEENSTRRKASVPERKILEVVLPKVELEDEAKRNKSEEKTAGHSKMDDVVIEAASHFDGVKKIRQIDTLNERRLKIRRRLKSIFHAVKVVCAVSIKVKRPSGDSSSSSSSSSEVHTISAFFIQNRVNNKGEKEGCHLFFDKWNFCKENSHKLSLAARIAAAKAPKTRTQAEVTLIQNVFNFLPNFKDKFSTEQKRMFGRAAWYLSCAKGRVVLRQGHPGTQFYVIISGRVKVQVDVIDELTGVAHTVETLHYESGATFGELALLSESGVRTASVYCDDITELFQIDKEDFMDICYDVFAAEMEQKYISARSYALYSAWDELSLRDLCFQSFIIHVPYGKIIEQDWAEATYVYFVLEGTVQILYNMQIPRNHIPKNLPSPLITGGSLVGMPEINEAPLRRRSWCTPRDDQRHQYVINRRCQEKIRDGTIVVGLLGPGECNDLRILCPRERDNVQHLQMFSTGVKLLRFSARLIQKIGQKNQVLDFVRKSFMPIQVPEPKQLLRMYLSEVAWQDVKLDIRENTIASAHHKHQGRR